ncbi:hypothetical protein ADUPG1_003409, partial [Aduncisulcus paluster]
MEESQSKKVQRWKMVLSEYDFKLHHIAGKENIIVDVLSRVRGDGRLPRHTLFATRVTTAREKLQKQSLEQQRLQPDEWKQKFEETETGWKKNGFLVVPESLEKKVMRLTHGEELESHAGA